MKKNLLFGLVAGSAVALSATAWAAEHMATPEEIVEKTQEAAQTVAEGGEGALDQFNQKDSEWVWKDTYVFVYNCDEGVMSAHPIKPSLAGMKLSEIKDKKGNEIFDDLCEAGMQEQGGWVEYWWSKPDTEGDFRKISYAVQAGDTPYQVAAGVYDEDVSVEELDAMLE